MTAKQIMARNGYVDETSLDYKQVEGALLKDLLSRLHEKPEMAALKINQYYVVREVQETSSGSRKEESLYQAAEIDEKSAGKLSKAFENQDFKVNDCPRVQATIKLEPWKKEALDFQRKIDSASSRASRAVQTCQSHILKLSKIFQGNHDPLADATRCNLEETSWPEIISNICWTEKSHIVFLTIIYCTIMLNICFASDTQC